MISCLSRGLFTNYMDLRNFRVYFEKAVPLGDPPTGGTDGTAAGTAACWVLRSCTPAVTYGHRPGGAALVVVGWES